MFEIHFRKGERKMKLKRTKIVSAILAVSMVLNTTGITVLAESNDKADAIASETETNLETLIDAMESEEETITETVEESDSFEETIESSSSEEIVDRKSVV